jgi:hypothetical protein
MSQMLSHLPKGKWLMAELGFEPRWSMLKPHANVTDSQLNAFRGVSL